MTRKQEYPSDQELDAMLKMLGDEAPAPSDDLMSRILADAEDLRIVPGAAINQAPEGFIESILSLLGGWKGAGGLVTAGFIGVWIGVSPPTTLEATTSDLWQIVSPDLTADWSQYDDFL